MTGLRAIPAHRSLGLLGVVLAGVVVLSACATDPGAPPTSSGDPSPETPASPSPSGEPSSSAPPAEDIVLPEACEDIYSAEMLGLLNEQNPPLNDPNVTLTATEVAPALELLESGVPTLRCSWGVPSEVGLATNVTIVDAEQSAMVEQALLADGFACEEDADGTLCTRSGENDVAAFGETHVLRGNGWVATRWINFYPDGYTEDVMTNLWA
ncbi:hypothetical protein M4I32_11380 [Microbacterium sp. LRZ72]|uniref:hypothetical protein n=1 Tax=Microbacterium sp. LRZ72 TaxID=2942481 RepID=UPI0029AF7E5E|nr:hypothetical protein [Microbacterium sp. LRZ72]MDX2377401.1 hypothetical protein [Microbacterium sp. LRZ72]